MLTHMLKTWNCKVNVVKNGLLAIEATEREKYDLILMDTHMPIMSGFEAIKQIRNADNEQLRAMPIITISASVLEHEQKAAFEVGADEVIGKPFNPVELYNKIVKVCNIQHTEETPIIIP
jgi:CheY-like chemotaxis protein